MTTAGIRPLMELTDADRPRRWSERGTWRSFSATLTLTFEPRGAFCDVTPSLQLRARRGGDAGCGVLQRLAPHAVRGDLKRAAAIMRDVG